MDLSGINSVVNVEENKPLKIGKKLKPKTELKQIKSEQCWLFRRIHILTWIKTYDRNKAIADLIAGMSLGLTIIPQSIAYASLAGISSQYGLYSSFVGAFTYVIFGSIPQVSIGPTSLMSLLTLKYTMDLPLEFVIMLAFMSGVVELIMGVLNLGFIVSLISHPVTSAFTTGSCVVIIKSQLSNLMGMHKINNGILNYVKEGTSGDFVLGIICIGILLTLRELNKLQFKTNCKLRRILKKFLWYISLSRNAIVVLCSSFLAYYLSLRNSFPFALSRKVNSTIPYIQPLPFVIEYENLSYSFLDICNKLGSGILCVPIIAVLANVAIAKAFGKSQPSERFLELITLISVKDSTLDVSQEMLTLGICNIAGSFFSAMPTSGAFTRSAVSEASGVRTPFAGVYTGGLVLLALGTLTPYFEYIPKSTLSAVLICAVFFMIDFKTLRELWKKNKTDCLNWIGVFIFCLTFGVEVGLLFGIVFNFSVLTIRLTNPKVETTLKNLNGYYFIEVTPCSEIYYTGADHLRSIIRSKCDENYNMYPVLIKCQKLMTQRDYTILLALKYIIKELKDKNIQVYLQNLDPKTTKHLCETESNVIFFNTEIELEMSISKILNK